MSDFRPKALYVDDDTESYDPVEKTEITLEMDLEITKPIDLASLRKERRRHPRYEAKMVVAIYSKNAFYRNMTADLSEGGLKLRDDLPPELAGQLLEVILMENDVTQLNTYYAFHGVCVPGTLNRIRFSSISERSDAAFFDLLDRLQQLQEQPKVA